MSQMETFYRDTTLGDGTLHINIGSLATNALARMLHYYDPSPKQTHEGLTFHMYAGFYFYLITSGDNARFLRAQTHRELDAKRKYTWENVPGLETHLEAVLSYNLRKSPLAIPLLVQHDLPIEWNEPDRGLRNAERRWCRVVQRTVARLRHEYAS